MAHDNRIIRHLHTFRPQIEQEHGQPFFQFTRCLQADLDIFRRRSLLLIFGHILSFSGRPVALRRHNRNSYASALSLYFSADNAASCF